MIGGETIVIGGGIIGAMCSYYLARSGRKVRLLDRAAFGSGCSHGNCGFVCPSHALPLAAPGAIGDALRALLRRNSPFRIKARCSPSLWIWLLRFARKCNRADMLNSAAARHALLQSSMRLYQTLLAEENIDCEWEARGLLFVYQSQREFEHYEKTDRLLQGEFGLRAEPYPGAELAKLEPALKSDLGGGWHYPGDAHLRPDKLMSHLREVLVRLGVAIEDHCDVTALEADRGAVRAAQTTAGARAGEAFVVAAGALTPLLNKSLQCRIPIQPGKGYSITMPRPARCPAIPMLLEEHRVAVTPMQSGYRLGSTMELAGYDESIKPGRLRLLTDTARLYLHEPTCEPIEEQWFGWRPLSNDDKPFIGRAPRLNNLWIAAGHGILGLSMGSATGKLLAEMINGETPHVDPAPFAVGRR